MSYLVNHNTLWRRLVIAGAVIWGAMLPLLTLAAVSFEPASVDVTLTWSGDDVTDRQVFCVQAEHQGQAGRYALEASTNGSTPFTLENGAGASVPFRVWGEDLNTGHRQELSPAVRTGNNYRGRRACPGNNLAMDVRFAESDLVAAMPGTYSGTLEVLAVNSFPPQRKRTQITYTLTIPDSIRVSGLNDIDLGLYSGADLAGSDGLCVYRRGGPDYNVIVTGEGAAGAFVVTDGGGHEIPLEATWNDGLGRQALTPDVALAMTNADSQDPDCLAGNTATLGVHVRAADVAAQGAQPGAYAGVLTVMVSPR